MKLIDILDKLPQYRQYEGYVMALCAFHDDHNPSMRVSDSGYYCYACGAKGNLQKLAERIGYTDYTVKTQIRVQGKFRNFNLPWHKWLDRFSMPELAFEAHRLLKKLNKTFYLRERGIERAIEPLEIGWMDNYYIFPIFDEWQEIVGLVARIGPGSQELVEHRYIVPPGQEPMLYIPDWGLLKSEAEIYVPFGIVDAITYWIAGKASVTGTSGKAIPPYLFDSIRKRLVIVPDLGEESAAGRLVNSLGWRGELGRVNYPLDSKDTNDLFVHHNLVYTV